MNNVLSLSYLIHRLALVWVLLSGNALVASAGMIDFDEKGQPIIHLGEARYSLPPARQPLQVRFRDPGLTIIPHGMKPDDFALISDDQVPLSSHWDADNLRLGQTFRWGEIIWSWTLLDEGANLTLTVRNHSERTLCYLDMVIGRFRFPEGSAPALVSERVYFGQPARATRMDSLSGPVILPMIIGDAVVLAGSPETEEHLDLRWQSLGEVKSEQPVKHNDPGAMALANQEAMRSGPFSDTGMDWELRLLVGGENLLWHERYASRPIPPGGQDVMTIWIRFGEADDPLAPASEIISIYREAHPPAFEWNDRRPILRAFIGDALPYHRPVDRAGSRPVGAEPSPALRASLMSEAESIVASLREVNAQGIIIWDVEGGRDPAIKYVGSPAMVEKLSPEMDQVADAFFERIREAGFRTGVCLRPTTLMVMEDEKGELVWRHRHPRDRDFVDVLSEKIRYAQERWGCTLFYIDTNSVWMGAETDQEREAWPKNSQGKVIPYHALMNAEQWRELARRHPDVLLIPEHSYQRYYASTAAYAQIDMGVRNTAPVIGAVWPNTFKMLCTTTPMTRFWEPTVAAQAAGEVVSFNAPLGQNTGLWEQVLRQVAFEKEGPAQPMGDWDVLALVALANDEHAPPGEQWHAMRELRQRETSVEPRYLLHWLVASDWLLAHEAYGLVGSPEQVILVPLMLDTLGRIDEFAPMNPVIRNALSRLGLVIVDPTALWIKAHLEAGDRQAVNRVLVAFAAIEGPGGSAVLQAVLNNTDFPPTIRVQAGRQLGRRPVAEDKAIALDKLEPFLDMPTVRDQTVAALLRVDGNRGRAIIRQRIDYENKKPTPDETLIQALQRSL